MLSLEFVDSAGLGMIGVPGGPPPPGGPTYVPGDDEEYGIELSMFSLSPGLCSIRRYIGDEFALFGFGHGLPVPGPMFMPGPNELGGGRIPLP